MNKKLSPGRRAYTAGMKALMYASTAAIGALVLFLIGYVLYRGIPNITWKFLTTAPSILNDTIGIWPDILNSIYVVIATIIIVLPLGVCAAIYLSEYASNKRLVRVIEYAAETLSGIPSIIYGLVGMLFFCEFLKMQTSLMAGALTLVIMNLPTVMRTTQESLKTVPQSYREGAFGLGAGKWRVIRTVVLPGCVDGEAADLSWLRPNMTFDDLLACRDAVIEKDGGSVDALRKMTRRNADGSSLIFITNITENTLDDVTIRFPGAARITVVSFAVAISHAAPVNATA